MKPKPSDFPDQFTRELADHLHYTHCGSSHTDQCGYAYSKWDDLRDYGEERARVYAKAADLIQRIGVEQLRTYLAVALEVRKVDIYR